DASGQYHLRSLKPGDALIDSQVILFEQAMVTTPPTREIIQQEVELQNEEHVEKRRSWKFWKKS
ncbi:MAG: hypothetical protein ACRDCC_07680, partial [Culicoidibacterales bacterium]